MIPSQFRFLLQYRPKDEVQTTYGRGIIIAFRDADSSTNTPKMYHVQLQGMTAFLTVRHHRKML